MIPSTQRDAAIEELKQRIDIVDVISEHVALKKSNKDYTGLCPFHEEKSPSFSVSPNKNLYYCFGCQVGGDAITFLMELGKCSFEDAVAELGQRYGVTVPGISDRDGVAAASWHRGIRRQPIKARNIPKQKTPTMPPPPPEVGDEGVKLARLTAPANDIPQPQKDFDNNHGDVLKTIYPYATNEAGKLQRWTVRTQWEDATKAKGYDKIVLPWHRDDNGKPICKKGEATWEAYRIDEAITSISNDGAFAALLIQEGEGCVEIARGLGLASITFQGGSWTVESMQPDIALFKRACIPAMLRDNDEAGESKAKLFLDCCATTGVFGVVVAPSDLLLPDEGELAKGADIKELLAMLGGDELIKRLEAQINKAINEECEKEPDSKEKQSGPYFTQNSLAQHIAERYRDKLAWNTELKEWFRYSAEIEGIWSKEPEEYIWQIVLAEVEVRVENPKKGFGAEFISGIIRLLKAHLAVRRWDETPRLLPLRNGVLNLQTKELVEHSPGYRLTWCLPYDYDITKTCQPIEDWILETVGGDRLSAELLRCYLNAVVKGRLDLQRFLELIGPGGTGKSTYIRLALALVGVRNTHITTLQKLETSRFETACIYGKRLVVVTDSERYAGGVSVLKALTGQDPLPYERKFKDSTSGFTPKAMVILAANEIIQSGDYTSGLERRRLPVPLKNQIPRDKQRNLIEFSEGELTGEFLPYIPGLLNWVLDVDDETVTNFIKRTDTYVPSLGQMWAETLCDTNPLADWADQWLVLRSDIKTNIGTAIKEKDQSTPWQYRNCYDWLYANYCEYSSGSGNKPVAVRRFITLLEDLLINQLKLKGISRGRDRTGSHFLGIRLRSLGLFATPADDDACLITGKNPPPPPPNPDDNGNPPPPPPPPMPTPVMDNVTVCDGTVTAETLGGDECDGCDGILKKSDEVVVVSSNLEDTIAPIKPEEVAADIVPSQTVQTLADSSVEPSQPAVTSHHEPSQPSQEFDEATIAEAASALAIAADCDQPEFLEECRELYSPALLKKAAKRLSPEQHGKLMTWVKASKKEEGESGVGSSELEVGSGQLSTPHSPFPSITVGTKVKWTKCYGHLEWMQPFTVLSILDGQARLDGLAHSVPLSELEAS